MFEVHLFAKSRQQLLAGQAECERLYSLTNPWLAAALLKLARQARQLEPQRRADELGASSPSCRGD